MELDPKVKVRRWLHQYPEVSFAEYKTSDYVCNFLDDLGLKYRRIATGVIAMVDTGRPGPHTAFRADMDALSLEELNKHDYKSKHQGTMHACGHDAHTTIMLFTVKAIVEGVKGYSGKFTFIFQHGEEIPPGGALALIEKGVLKGVDQIFGLHCDPEYDLGQVMSKEGPLMAAVDKFQVTVIGKGGHGAMPQLTVDPIVLTAQIITNLQTVVSRNTDPLKSTLITIGQLHGGHSFNVIPESVTFEGTVRTLDKAVRARTEARIRTILDGMTQAYQASYTIDWDQGYPVLYNDAACVGVVEEVVTDILGQASFIKKKEARLLGEDFASYLEKVPGAFFFLGTRSGESTSYPLHSPRFDLDEKALQYGVDLFVGLAKRYNDKD